MKCSKAKKLITLHAGDDLDPEEAKLLEKHLFTCVKCRALLAACRTDRELVAALREQGPEPPAFGEFWTRLKVEIEPEVRKRKARVVLHRVLRGITAAAVLLIVVTFLASLGHENGVELPFEESTRELFGSLREEVNLEKAEKGQRGLELEECELCVDTNRKFDF